MKVRLLRKFADLINGIDLSKAKTGETLDLPAHDANMLMAEGWAEFEGQSPDREKADEQQPPTRRPRRAKKRVRPSR